MLLLGSCTLYVWCVCAEAACLQMWSSCLHALSAASDMKGTSAAPQQREEEVACAAVCHPHDHRKHASAFAEAQLAPRAPKQGKLGRNCRLLATGPTCAQRRHVEHLHVTYRKPRRQPRHHQPAVTCRLLPCSSSTQSAAPAGRLPAGPIWLPWAAPATSPASPSNLPGSPRVCDLQSS